MTTRTKNNTLAEIAEFLKTLDRVAVTTHVGSDGDAIGASAALVRLMRRLGATAVFCHAEGAPEYLGWLLPDEPLRELPPDHDLLVADTSRADRTGVPVPEAGARLNIDHHEDNPLYAEYNLVSPRAAATAEIVADLYAELEVPIDRPTAEALYVHPNTLRQRLRQILGLIAAVESAQRASGRVHVPGDKSISHRYALLGALAASLDANPAQRARRR